jgi:hypothetical protein
VLKIDTNFCPIIEYFEIIFKIYWQIERSVI